MAARQHVEKGYDSAVRAAVVAGEAFDRKAAAEKGKTSGASKESEDMGADAKKKWADLKQALLLTHAANFDLTFKQRYLELRIDEQGLPTTAGLEQLTRQLQCVPPDLNPAAAQ